MKSDITQLTERTLTILIGYSGSGKSTYARSLMQTRPNTVCISRDKIREMLFSYSEDNISEYYQDENLQANENLVSAYLGELVLSSLMAGKDVIIDNTNLDIKYIKQFHKQFYYCNIELVDAPTINNCTLELAIERDNKRVRQVGEKVIKGQYQRYKSLVSKFNFTNGILNLKPYHAIIQLNNDSTKPACIIFDIDGTLADNNGRNPFDWKKVHEDSLRTNIAKILEYHNNVRVNKPKIIICTGRSAEAATLTKSWLDDYGIYYDDFYIRKSNDYRPDWQVKEEMWREIVQNHYIVGQYDDRNSIILHSRLLGIDCMQVNYGNF